MNADPCETVHGWQWLPVIALCVLAQLFAWWLLRLLYRVGPWLWRMKRRVLRITCRHRRWREGTTSLLDDPEQPMVFHVVTLRDRHCLRCERAEVRRGSEWKLSPRDPYYRAPKDDLFP